MTKKEFIDALSSKTGMTKAKTSETVDTILEIIVSSCQKKESIQFTGFGTFEARQNKATKRINPQTGKQVSVPARWVPKFRAGANFKSSLN